MSKQWRQLWDIFFVFFKIGPSTFGGGFAMIPSIEKEIVTKRGWLTKEDITDIFALSQSIPGAISINAATFVGYRINGLIGALAAIIGISLPTFLIVLLLGFGYLSMKNNEFLQSAFISIRVTIVAIIAYAAINVAKTAIIDKTTMTLAIIGVPALFFIHPIFILICGAIIGICSNYMKQRKSSQSSTENQSSNNDQQALKRVNKV